MKKLLILLLLTSSAFSATSELLLPCSSSDLDKTCSEYVYKITDGNVTCYYTNARGNISCVKNKE